MKGLRSTNWLLQNSHADIKYSTEKITKIHDPRTWTMVWELPTRVGRPDRGKNKGKTGTTVIAKTIKCNFKK